MRTWAPFLYQINCAGGLPPRLLQTNWTSWPLCNVSPAVYPSIYGAPGGSEKVAERKIRTNKYEVSIFLSHGINCHSSINPINALSAFDFCRVHNLTTIFHLLFPNTNPCDPVLNCRLKFDINDLPSIQTAFKLSTYSHCFLRLTISDDGKCN